LKVGLVGCGLIGKKRAAVLQPSELVVCSDLKKEAAQSLAAMYPGTQVVDDWAQVVTHPDIDTVIVSTANNALSEIANAAVNAGKHVLLEKPAGASMKEVEELDAAARKNKCLVRVGFNHRFHPALLKAREILDSGELGELMFLRGRYGHGGRVGYDREWRADPKLSGGGELLDQGVHLIDLSRWILGDFVSIQGYAHTYFWDMPVDDNGFLLLRTKQEQTAFLHVSCSEWKNLFSMEIYGKTGKLQIDGLGGSYGIERLTWYRMLPEMGPPDTSSWEYPRGDNSWRLEFDEFREDIRLNRQPAAGLPDALAAWRVVDQVVRDSGYDYYT